MPTETTKPDLVERLWESDAASALTNEAAREIKRLRAANAKMLRAMDAIAEAYLGLEGIRIAEFQTTEADDPPYDVMSLDELREDREGIEATLRHAAMDGDKERAAHTVMQLDWYNRAIQWRLQNVAG